MRNSFRRKDNNLWWRIVYLFLISMTLLVKTLIEELHFSVPVYLVLSAGFFIPEWISEYKPRYMGWIIAQRTFVVDGVLAVCILAGTVCFFRYPLPAGYWTTLESDMNFFLTIIQGMILGLVTRMLLIHLSHRLIASKEVTSYKLLIVLIYMAFLIMVPLRYRFLLCPFFIAGGLGFLIHYLTRASEKKHARRDKLKNNLLDMIDGINKKNGPGLLVIEDQAIKQYAHREWRSLKKLLRTIHHETEKIFFIRIAMHTILHEHDRALSLLEEMERNNPEWYESNKHYFFLLRVLNRFQGSAGSNTIPKDVFDGLTSALTLVPDCLLSNALMALLLAYNDQQPELALGHIERAMLLYEQRDRNPEPVSFIIGIIESCTYAFLIDIYGYVLIKNGRLTLARTLLTQCLLNDASHAPAYLHIAEWYIEYYDKREHKNEHWKKAAELCLYIAIYTERLEAKDGYVSKTEERAWLILGKL